MNCCGFRVLSQWGLLRPLVLAMLLLLLLLVLLLLLLLLPLRPLFFRYR